MKLYNNASDNPVLLRMIKNMVFDIENKNREVKLIWIKAHCGLTENEYVDQLAKNAPSNWDMVEQKIPIQDLFVSIRKEIFMEWNDRYINKRNSTPTNYSDIYPCINKKRLHQNSKVSRKMYITITRLKFNHCRTPSHLYKIGVKDNNLCICGKTGNINHLIFECEITEQHRSDFLDTLFELGTQLPTNVNNLLSTNNINIYRALFKYIEEENILI